MGYEGPWTTFGLGNGSKFPEKGGCSGWGNPFCFVFLRMVAGVRFELTTFGRTEIVIQAR